MPTLPLIYVEDYKLPTGWVRPDEREERAQAYCDLLESGQILFFHEPPFLISADNRAFLLAQKWAELRLH